MLNVLFQCFAEYYDICNINEGGFSFNNKQDHVYSALKGSACVAKPKWHPYKAIETVKGCEYVLVVIIIINLYSSISANSV